MIPGMSDSKKTEGQAYFVNLKTGRKGEDPKWVPRYKKDGEWVEGDHAAGVQGKLMDLQHVYNDKFERIEFQFRLEHLTEDLERIVFFCSMPPTKIARKIVNSLLRARAEQITDELGIRVYTNNDGWKEAVVVTAAEDEMVRWLFEYKDIPEPEIVWKGKGKNKKIDHRDYEEADKFFCQAIDDVNERLETKDDLEDLVPPREEEPAEKEEETDDLPF